MKFRFEEEKAINAVLYVVKKIKENGEQADFHKIFKIIYFADKDHLSNWGRPITGDYFVAMSHGPVPSAIYDIFKSIKGDNPFISPEKYTPFFDIHDVYMVTDKQEPDLDLLSESDLDALNKSIEENVHLGFSNLVNKSHDSAWESAPQDDKMSYEDIAKEAGANPEMLAYIEYNADNSTFWD